MRPAHYRPKNANGIPEGYIRLENGDFGWDYIIRSWDDRTVLVQTDWEYPGFAGTFGRQLCHDGTDGTVRCPTCGRTAGSLINEAQEYLDENIGKMVLDPGYFDED